jgi:hypothetical protein
MRCSPSLLAAATIMAASAAGLAQSPKFSVGKLGAEPPRKARPRR